MTSSKFRAHTGPLFKNLIIIMLKLPELRIVKILKLCFNLFNNNLPDQDYPRLTNDNTHYCFRNKTYKLPLVKSSTGYNISGLLTIHQIQ